MHKKWRERLPYLQNSVGKKNLDQMAQELKVSKAELSLFLHRNRLFPIKEERNLVKELIQMRFIYPEYFMPTKQFFELTGIKQRRFWQLYRGEKQLKDIEYFSIATHLQISLEDAFNNRQLTLFQ